MNKKFGKEEIENWFRETYGIIDIRVTDAIQCFVDAHGFSLSDGTEPLKECIRQLDNMTQEEFDCKMGVLNKEREEKKKVEDGWDHSIKRMKLVKEIWARVYTKVVHDDETEDCIGGDRREQEFEDEFEDELLDEIIALREEKERIGCIIGSERDDFGKKECEYLKKIHELECFVKDVQVKLEEALKYMRMVKT
jgi:hypothetical protein